MDQENSGAFLDELDWASVAVSAAAGMFSARVDQFVNGITTDAFKNAPETVSTRVAKAIVNTNITTSRSILQIVIPKAIFPSSNPRTRQYAIPMVQ